MISAKLERGRPRALGAAIAAVGLAFGGLAFGLGLAGPAQAETKVIYLLPAPPSLPAFAPMMIAKQKGYYKEAGLDVEFQVGKGGVDVAKQIGAGNVDIGNGLGDGPIIVRPNGVPVKSVALLGGGSMMVIAARPDAGINSPKDLKGKTVTVLSYQDTTYYALLGVLASVGLNKNDVNIQAVGPAGVPQLVIAGKADACACVPDWAVNVQDGVKGAKLFPSKDYFPSMAQAIIASDKAIAEKPQLIGAFVKATLRAFKEIMDDPKAAAAVYVEALPAYKGKEELMERILAMYTELTYKGQATPGMMDEARLAKLQDFYLAQGFIEKKSPVKDLYTNQFVK